MWHHRPGKALDVAVYDNAVMVIGTDRRFYRYNHMTRSWARTTGVRGNSIAVGPEGQAIITSSDLLKGIYYQSN